MVLAIAALFLQFAPAVHVFADVNSTTPLFKSATADATTNTAKPATLASSNDSATGNAIPTAFTLAKLEGSSQHGQSLETIRVPDPTSFQAGQDHHAGDSSAESLADSLDCRA